MMIASDVVVVVAALILTGLLTWYFFGPKRVHEAQRAGGA